MNFTLHNSLLKYDFGDSCLRSTPFGGPAIPFYIYIYIYIYDFLKKGHVMCNLFGDTDDTTSKTTTCVTSCRR